MKIVYSEPFSLGVVSTREIEMKDIHIVDDDGEITLEDFLLSMTDEIKRLNKELEDVKLKLEEHDRNIQQIYGSI